MTLPSTPRRAGPYNGNGSATSFAFTFKVFADEDIRVVRTNSVGVETTLTLDSDYSVTLNGDQETNPGGSVTYPISGSPLAVGLKLTIAGALEYDQPTDIPDGGNFSPTALENALDRIEMQIQQLDEGLDRAVTLPVSVTGVNSQLPAPVANYLVGWNNDGTGFVNRSVADVASVVAFADWRADLFNGTGSQTGFTLSADPGNINNMDVVVSGVPQRPGEDYTLSGTALTFSTAPPSGTKNVMVRYGSALPSSMDASRLARLGVSPEDFGASANGVADDTTAAALAFAACKTVELTPGKTYKFGDLQIPVNGKLDGRGAIILRTPGAKHAVVCDNYRSTLYDCEVQGTGSPWISTAFSGASSAGTDVVNVTSATGLVVGMTCFYPSTWADGGIEANEIESIVGTAVTLKNNLRGNVASGGKFLADFALVKTGGSQYAGRVGELFIRNCLLGIESGNNGSSGGNAFTAIGAILVEDYVGAALKVSANIAAEEFSVIRGNGGKTLASDYTGNGATVRFAIPYNLAKKCYRWGSEPSIRLVVNGTRLATTAYTLDLATMEVVANTPPANGATVQIQNYEYAAFGILGQNIAKTQGSSIEGVSNTLMLACNIGQFYDACELGFFSNVRMDTCGYAGTLLYACDGMYCRGFDNLYSPFGVIINADCFNISLAGGIGTSLIPDSEEFSATTGKKEIVARAFATRIHIDFLSWLSKDGYTMDVADAIYPTESKTHFQPDGIAVGGVPSGLFIGYGTSSRFVQVTEDADEVVLGGGVGTKFVQAKGTNVTLRVGAPESGGNLELTCGTGVRLTLDSFGRILAELPTSSAGLPSKALWDDAGTIKRVP